MAEKRGMKVETEGRGGDGVELGVLQKIRISRARFVFFFASTTRF